ncbi:MAG TPA: site-2 protease family protein [Polyangia bacterium]
MSDRELRADFEGLEDSEEREIAPWRRKWREFGKPILLFLITVATTTATGALFVHPDSFFPLTDGLSFSVPLLAILLCHEFGHYFAARHHGVPASLPYFIPLPPGLGLFGTMGAVISQEGTTDRRKLIDIGAAGPLAGLVVAIPVLIYGLTLSEVKPLVGLGQQEGNSLLYAGLKYLTKGAFLPSDGRDVMLHPTAFAGWAGLFVTMLNLLPIGQLDGGHVATAFFGNRYRRAARIVHQALPWLSLIAFGWIYRKLQLQSGPLPENASALEIAILSALPWMVWFVLLWVLGRLARGLDHPPVDDHTPLPRSRTALFWVVAVVFALIFMPVPFGTSVGAPVPQSALTTPAAATAMTVVP